MKKQFGKKANTTTPALTVEEIENIQFMAEEEKLAQDVYDALGDLWDLNVFDNIEHSESQHVSSVESLASKYNISTPDLPEGVFANEELQALYDQLIAIGSQSLEDALKVGVAIETVDIEDLTQELSSTTNTDLISTYTKLLSASENHLSAFSNALTQESVVFSSDMVNDWLATEISLLGQTESLDYSLV